MLRDEPDAGRPAGYPAGPDVRIRSGPADFQPDLSRIFQVFLLTFEHLFTMFFGFKLAF